MTGSPPTFIWAPEIETAVISILWRQPERCAELLRVLDPAVHLFQPHLRIILEAINLSYSELGHADWAAVVQVVRELGQLENCGGLDGLNAVYSAHEPTSATPQIFNHYVGLLQEYARSRQSDPPRNVYRFAGGRGTVWHNKAKRRASEPDFSGDAIVRGIKYRVSVQIAPDSSAMNLRLDPQ